MARMHPQIVIDTMDKKEKSRSEKEMEHAAGNPQPEDAEGKTAYRQPLEEDIRMPTMRGPVFWWTVGLMLVAVLAALLWLGNLLAVY